MKTDPCLAYDMNFEINIEDIMAYESQLEHAFTCDDFTDAATDMNVRFTDGES